MPVRKYQYKELFMPGKKYSGLGDDCMIRLYPHAIMGKPSWAAIFTRSGFTFFRPSINGNSPRMFTREGFAYSDIEWREEDPAAEDDEVLRYAAMLLTKGDVVYFIEAEWAAQIKIGYTSSFIGRYCAFLVEYPMPVKVLALLPGGVDVESAMHSRFAHLRIHNQWFRDCTELRQYISSLNPHRDDATRITKTA